MGEIRKCNLTVSCISDLLTPAQENKSWTLDENTILNAGTICFDHAEKMRSVFTELLDLHLSDRKRDRASLAKGYQTMRFSGTEICTDPACASQELAQYLHGVL
jgi:hypothetical protein